MRSTSQSALTAIDNVLNGITRNALGSLRPLGSAADDANMLARRLAELGNASDDAVKAARGIIDLVYPVGAALRSLIDELGTLEEERR